MRTGAAARLPSLHALDAIALNGLTIFGVAIALRLLFAWLTSGTYDYDEFVLLLLARDFAHGSMPYQSFMFFHPPGALVLLRAIEPLTNVWWPLARLGLEVVDACTAVLVWWIGKRIWNGEVGTAAGMLYACSPLALIASVRVGQDPLMTAFGVAAVASLLAGSSWRWTILSGICLGLAIWMKYPAAYFVPVCVLVAPRRAPAVLLCAGAVFCALMIPFRDEISAIYNQTIAFQRTRWSMGLSQRILTTALYWIAVNVLAVPGLFRRSPPWLMVGFLLGGLFVLTSQVYYHYFVPVVPFAALLAGRTLVEVPRPPRLAVACGILGITALWAAVIDFGGLSPLYVTAARLSNVAPTVALLDRDTHPNDAVLADRFEYAYLARRPSLSHYFWNVGVLVDAQYLERRVRHSRAVVLSYGASSGYPPGFVPFLDARYQRLNRPTTTVWLIPRSTLTQ